MNRCFAVSDLPPMQLLACFEVPGRPVGYVRMVGPRGRRILDARARRYHDYAEEVRARALAAGVRGLQASPERRILLVTQGNLRNWWTPHPDPDNVFKSATDAIFYGAPGGDRFVGGLAMPHRYGLPRGEWLEVWIYEVERGWGLPSGWENMGPKRRTHGRKTREAGRQAPKEAVARQAAAALGRLRFRGRR